MHFFRRSHFLILVINRVRVLGSGPHTPTQFFCEYPPREKNTGYFREDSRIPVFGASHLTTSSKYLQSKKHFNSYEFCFHFKFCLHFGQKLYFLKITEGNGIQLSSVGIEYKQRHLNQPKHNLSRGPSVQEFKAFQGHENYFAN